MLTISNLTYRIGGRVLFDSAGVQIAANQRIGLVGRNGTGKSTLFKLIKGELSPDSGMISLSPRTKMGDVAQETPDGPDSLIDTVLAHDKERAALLIDAETSEDGHHLAEVHERLNAIDAHTAPARAAGILAGLGFDAEAQERPVSSFSGGWRMRVALAGALFARPDLLLLDEPTNHLDLEATLWLENYLASYEGTLIVISHDRDILNTVVDRIIHLDQGKLVAYGGNYDRFEQVRREQMELQGKAAVKQAAARAHLQSFVDRFRAKASKAAQAQSRIKMLEKLGPPISVIEDQPVSFDFPDPDELPPPVISVDHGQAGYQPGKPVLKGLHFRIDMDDRIALLGANGNGKSTLAKILAGRLALQSGDTFRSPKLKIGYFAQHQTDELNLNGTPFQHMQELMKDAPPSKVRAQLGRFGFSRDRANLKVGVLSGGEKTRLLLALATRTAPHMLLLDEPTNHLDIDSREALVAALNAYQGAVVLISHDPRLIELTADRLWLVADGKVTDFDGDMAAYRALLLNNSASSRRANRAEAKKGKDERKAAADQRALLAPLRKKAEEAEKLVTKLTAQKTKLEAELADPKLYNGPPDAVTKVKKSLAEVERELGVAEEDWLTSQEALEQAGAAL